MATKTRRKRTTSIRVAVPTTFKALAKHLGINEGTLTARYHRIQDAFPRRVVTLEALTVNHRTNAFKDTMR